MTQTIAAGTGKQRLTAQGAQSPEKAAKRRRNAQRVARDEKPSARGLRNPRLRERGESAQEHAADHRVRAVRGVLPVPFVYLLINATKTQADFTSTFGLEASAARSALWDNIKTVFTRDGIFGRWFLNTILCTVVGAGGATSLLAIMARYGWRVPFPGRKAVRVIIGAISVPGIALAVPFPAVRQAEPDEHPVEP